MERNVSADSSTQSHKWSPAQFPAASLIYKGAKIKHPTQKNQETEFAWRN